MSFTINDTVTLLVDLPGDALKRGAIGVVVAEFAKPQEAYEIEFCDENGETTAQVAVLPNQIALVQ